MEYKTPRERFVEIVEESEIGLRRFCGKFEISSGELEKMTGHKSFQFSSIIKTAEKINRYPVCIFNENDKIIDFGVRELVRGDYPENYVGNAIRFMRIWKKMNLVDTAKDLNIAHVNLSRIEKGQIFPLPETLRDITDFLQLTPIYFVSQREVVDLELPYARDVLKQDYALKK
jgi:hypothetical protein